MLRMETFDLLSGLLRSHGIKGKRWLSRVKLPKIGAERMVSSNASGSLEGIAIIGMAGRFPGAKNIQEFWDNLKAGVESISFFSDEELAASGVDVAEVKDDPTYVRARGILPDADLFDAAFFGVYPKEAELMDPQGRVMLECAWQALEDAGYDPETYAGTIGVYAGVSTSNAYFLKNLYPNRRSIEAVKSFQTLVNNEPDSLTMRISYKLNLTGPSVTVLTTCASSLVAVYHACQNLLHGQCDMVLVGGVCITLPQKRGYWYQEGGMDSRDGHCRPFDENASGTVFGNGAGMVVLKRLRDAVSDGDHIYAVIKGIAVNNDGSSKGSYAAPSVDGQAKVIALAHADAGVDPESISYVEAHGTATPTGDPIEVAGLTKAFRNKTDKNAFCALGSVKSNVGHLDSAAGITGLIKTALSLKHRTLPPTLHFTKPNPKLNLGESPFYVNDKFTEWKVEKTPRLAGLNSFGVGGTNAHAVLQEAPPIDPSGGSRSWQLLLLSAKTDTALEKATSNLAEFLKSNPELNLADAAYTLQVGRRAFDHRRAVLCKDLNDAVSKLQSLDPKTVATKIEKQRGRPVVFMFPGQGAQYVNMGLDLYRSEATFREAVDHCAEVLRPLVGIDLRAVLYPREQELEKSARQLKETVIAQPAIFVIEYALAKLWMEWGILPQKMIGHSIGEYTAACLAGVFTLDDALALLSARGRLMQSLPGGSMLAVPLPETDLAALLGPDVSLAAINSPSNCVIAGPKDAVEAFEKKLLEREVACRPLHTSHAFHSLMMDPILETFKEEIRKVKLSAPRIPFLSSPTGRWITAEQATDPSYWALHLREPVRFCDGRKELARLDDHILLEVGPGNTLTTLAQHPSYGAADQVVLSSLGHVLEDHHDVASTVNTLGRLWLAGASVDWRGFHSRQRRQRVPLPTYPFERKRYWIDPPASHAPEETATGIRPSAQPASQAIQPLLTVSTPIENLQADEVRPPMERVISQQLRLMVSQLEVLSGSQALSAVTNRRDGLAIESSGNGFKP
jgi:acyl transferase domain-containing protein